MRKQRCSTFVSATSLYIDSTIPLLSKSEILSLKPACVIVQPDFCIRPGWKSRRQVFYDVICTCISFFFIKEISRLFEQAGLIKLAKERFV